MNNNTTFTKITAIFIVLLYLQSSLSLFAQNPGDLDSTFGNGGMVRTTLQPNTTASDGNSILQPNGKIIISIFFQIPNQPQTLIARYLTDGSLDPDWGQNGIVTTTIQGASQVVVPNDLYLLPDDKLLVVGYRDTSAGQLPSGYPCCLRPFIMKYNTNGSLDSSFGNNGVSLPLEVKNETPWALTVSGNRIITSGFTNDIHPDSNGIRLSAFHLNDGTLDTSWGNNGHNFISLFSSSFERLITQPDQKILLAVSGYVYRFTADGQVDSTFGPSQQGFFQAVEATAGLGVNQGKMSIILQPNNKILIAAGAHYQSPYSSGSVVERYHTNGILDSSFANNGLFPFYFAPFGTIQKSEILDMKLQPDGKILIGGEVTHSLAPASNIKNSFGLARFDTLGNIDTAFGNNGVVFTIFNTEDSIQYTRNIHLQPDGKIIQTGFSLFYNGNYSSPSTAELNIARFWGDSVLITNAAIPTSPTTHFDFYPNPSKTTITTTLSLDKTGQTTLAIYDIQGRMVQQLLNKTMPAGNYQETFTLSSKLAAGVYVLKLQTENTQYARMLVVQ